VATLVLPVARLTVSPPAGAAAEMFTVMLEVAPTTTGRVVGVNVTLTATFAVRESGAKPIALAVICAEPMFTPVTCGLAAGT